jgi:hypothetical protein
MRRLSLLVVSLLALAGCGGGGRVDAHQVERLIKNRFTVVEGVPVRDVTCPRDVPQRSGRTFVCITGMAARDPVEVVVTERGTDRFTIVPALSAYRLEVLLSQRGFGGAMHVSVLGAKCPNGVPYRAGSTLRCQVALGGGERVPVVVRQTDGRGSVRFSAATIIATEVQGDIAGKLASRGVKPQVTCPRGLPIEPGRRFSCTARDGGERAVSVTILNRRGDVRFSIPL